MADHPLYAAVYDRALRRAEAGGLAARRRLLLTRASGRVLEIGGGTGLNLSHYAGIGRLTVLEPDGAMRRKLLERVARAAFEVEVHEEGIDEVTFAAASFDTVVSTLTLCTVPDLDRSLSSVRRWLAPGGRFLFLEHTREAGLRGGAQKLVTPLWRRVVPGCHLDRDVTQAVRRAGFAIIECDHFTLPGMTPLARFVVHGVARHKMAP